MEGTESSRNGLIELAEALHAAPLQRKSER
jgi:hypothetical protein